MPRASQQRHPRPPRHLPAPVGDGESGVLLPSPAVCDCRGSALVVLPGSLRNCFEVVNKFASVQAGVIHSKSMASRLGAAQPCHGTVGAELGTILLK